MANERKLDPKLVGLFGSEVARFHQLLATEQRAESMRLAVGECLSMLEQLADVKNDDGTWLLCGYYVDPFGAINDARRSIGLEPINWNKRNKTALERVGDKP
jgi:hypothetical protein